MKKLSTYIAFVLLVFTGCLTLHAQSFTATASKTTVGVGESFQVDFAATNIGGSFSPPSFSGFQPVGQSSMSSMDGKNSSTTFSYELLATKEGTFTIPGATITSNGKTVSSNTVTIKVVKGSTSTQQGGNNSANDKIKQNLFEKIMPERTEVYEGEAIPVTVKIYTRYNLQNLKDHTEPDFTGFYVENIPQTTAEIKADVYNGAQYYSVLMKQGIVFPQHAGKITIDPATAQCIVLERSNDPWSQIFGVGKRQEYDIKSDPVTIDVLPLPHTDKDFSGIVGHLNIKASLDKTNLKANDAVNLNVTVSGDGELKLIDSLPFRFPADFDHYDPKIADHISVKPTGVSGSRTFTYVLIPRHQGSYKIPEVDFTYFDPSKKVYVTLTIPEIPMEVAKGDGSSATVAVSGQIINKEDVKLLGSDIRYIHTGHMFAYQVDGYFLYSIPFLAGVLAPILGFFFFFFARRRYVEMNKDISSVKQRGATRMAKKRLKTANTHIASNNKEKFYEELHKAITGYLGDKFTIPVADLSHDTITHKLTEMKASPEALQKLNSVLDSCEFARYAPSSVTGNLGEVYESAVQLITQLEDETAR